MQNIFQYFKSPCVILKNMWAFIDPNDNALGLFEGILGGGYLLGLEASLIY